MQKFSSSSRVRIDPCRFNGRVRTSGLSSFVMAIFKISYKAIKKKCINFLKSNIIIILSPYPNYNLSEFVLIKQVD